MGWSWRPVAGAVTGLSHQTDLPSIVRARLRRTGGAQGVAFARHQTAVCSARRPSPGCLAVLDGGPGVVVCRPEG
jgi:hypothetical protein